MNTLMNIEFAGTTLNLVDYQGEPYVPMKPVVEGIGMQWNSQREKISSSMLFKSSTMQVRGSGAQSYTMLVIPLKKLPGWLFSINTNLIPDEERKKVVIKFQEECDEVLWTYWNNKKAGIPVGTVDKAVFNQVRLERDIAISQASLFSGQIKVLETKLEAQELDVLVGQIMKGKTFVNIQDVGRWFEGVNLLHLTSSLKKKGHLVEQGHYLRVSGKSRNLFSRRPMQKDEKRGYLSNWQTFATREGVLEMYTMYCSSEFKMKKK